MANTTGIRNRGSVVKLRENKDALSSPHPVPGARSSWSRTRSIVLLAIAATASICALSLLEASPNEPPATYGICTKAGANIYTVDDSLPHAECMVIKDQHIAAVGSPGEIRAEWKHVPIYPVNGVVYPGLSDSHAHTLEYGLTKLMDLESGKTIEETVAVVRKFILTNPEIHTNKSIAIEGWGWDHTVWPTERWPTADDLEADPVLAGRSIVLQSKDGHALWVSRKVLDDSKPFPDDPEGGYIIRDPSGEASGVFIDNSQDLVKRASLTEADLKRRFGLTVADAHSFGVTSIHDAGFNPISLQFFKRLADEGPLPVRIYGMTYFDENGEYWGNKTTPIIDHGEGTLTARSVKIFADGALRSGGAALYEPYADNPSTSGVMRTPKETLDTVIPQFLRDGWQTNVHAIGDLANAIVLDSFELASETADVPAMRPRIEHAQILKKSDMARLGRLGVIASVQPTHVLPVCDTVYMDYKRDQLYVHHMVIGDINNLITDDMWYAQDRLGPERVKNLYAFRSIADGGARLTLGSDAPVEGINPIAGFYAAITRLTADGTSPHGPGGWFPEERLTREEALRGMTIDPAYASFSEDKLGSITVGKRADFVILSQDIMQVPVEKILSTRVLATVMNGKAVYGHF